jgi:hypothetical protein
MEPLQPAHRDQPFVNSLKHVAAAMSTAKLVWTLCSITLLLLTALLAPAGQVNSLTSFETDLPFEYYAMPFCKPPEGVHRAGNAANLGTVIMGIKLLNSQYNFTIMVRISAHQQQQQEQQRQDSATCSWFACEVTSSMTLSSSDLVTRDRQWWCAGGGALQQGSGAATLGHTALEVAAVTWFHPCK